MKISNLINKFRIVSMSPEQYAKSIGVKIGNNCFIATKCFGSEPYLITIGNNCQITDNVRFHTHGGAHVARQFYPDFDVFGKIVVEDWAYIGSGSHIMPGVTIGKGSLIAAGSIVTKSIPADEVWGGIPAKKICTVTEYIEKNMPFNLNSKSMPMDDKRQMLEKLSADKFIKK